MFHLLMPLRQFPTSRFVGGQAIVQMVRATMAIVVTAVGIGLGVGLGSTPASASTAWASASESSIGWRRSTAKDLLETARVAPADTTLLVHIEDAAGLRRAFGDSALVETCAEWIGEPALRGAWQSLADRSGRSSVELFDVLLGQRLTLIARGELDDESVLPDAWVVAARVDSTTRRELDSRWRLQRMAPRSERPVGRLPEHDLIVAFAGDTCLIGPADHDDVFDDVLARLADSADELRLPRLAQHEAFRNVDHLGDGSIAVWWRGDDSRDRTDEHTDDWTTILADPRGNEVRVIVDGRSEVPLFTRPPTSVSWNPESAWAMVDDFAVVIAEPTDHGWGNVGTFVETTIGKPLLSRPMLESIGDQRLFVLDAIDDRIAGAVAIESRADVTGIRNVDAMLDTHVLSMVRSLIRRATRDAVLMPPVTTETPEVDSQRVRFVSLDEVCEHTGVDSVFGPGTVLAWDATVGRGHVQTCLSTSHTLITRLSRAFDQGPDSLSHVPEFFRGSRTWTAAGVFRGDAVSTLLRIVGRDVMTLSGMPDDERVAAQAEVDRLASFASCFDTVTWAIERPERQRVRALLAVRLVDSVDANDR